MLATISQLRRSSSPTHAPCSHGPAGREAGCQCAVAVPGPPGAHRAGGFAVGTGRFPSPDRPIEARRSSIRHCGRRDLSTVHTSLSNRSSHEASSMGMARDRDRRVRSGTWRIGVSFSESDLTARRPALSAPRVRPPGPACLAARWASSAPAFSSPPRMLKCTAASLVPLHHHQRERTKPSAGRLDPHAMDSHVRERAISIMPCPVIEEASSGTPRQATLLDDDLLGCVCVCVCCHGWSRPRRRKQSRVVRCSATRCTRRLDVNAH